MWKEGSIRLQSWPEEAISTPGVLPGSPLSVSSTFSSLSCRLPQNQSGTQTGERFLANAMSSNTLSLRISLSQMQMCCIISLASRLFRLEKCVLINVGNSKKEVSEKVRLNQTKKPAHIVVSRSHLLNKEGVKLLTIDVIKNT